MTDSEVIERLEALEETVEEQSETIEEQSETIEEQADRIESLEEQLRETQRHTGRERAELTTRVATLEDTVEAAEAVAGGDAEALEREDVTPIEQAAALPEHVAEEQLNTEQSRNIYRARYVFRQYLEQSTKTPSGLRLTSPEIQRIVSIHEDGPSDSNTGKRVCLRLEEWSDGRIEHVPAEESSRGEHMVFLDPTDFVTLAGDGSEDGTAGDGVVGDGGR